MNSSADGLLSGSVVCCGHELQLFQHAAGYLQNVGLFPPLSLSVAESEEGRDFSAVWKEVEPQPEGFWELALSLFPDWMNKHSTAHSCQHQHFTRDLHESHPCSSKHKFLSLFSVLLRLKEQQFHALTSAAGCCSSVE